MTTKGSTLARATEDRFNGLSPSELNEMEKQSLVALALSLLANRHRAGVLLSSPDETRSYLRLRLAERKNEVFGCVFVDLCAVLRNVELGHPDRLLMRFRRRQLHISGYSRRIQLTMSSCSGATCPAWGGGITSGKT